MIFQYVIPIQKIKKVFRRIESFEIAIDPLPFNKGYDGKNCSE